MVKISAQMVKELRDQTGVGMMDCKRALTEADGDMELAVEHLRKAGIAKAAKKAGRTATEGCVVFAGGDGVASLAEVLCETDFVAKTDRFREFAASVAERAVSEMDGDGDISAAVAAVEKTRLAELVGVIGENMQIRRVCRWETSDTFAHYLHMGGKIGVLIEAAGSTDEDLLNDVCMHIAAFSPQYIIPEDVPAEVLEKEKEIAAAQVEGKPANILEKIVAGKLNKWYTETCLMRQPWIRDDKTCLAKLAPQLTIKRFVRWQVGEEL